MYIDIQIFGGSGSWLLRWLGIGGCQALIID